MTGVTQRGPVAKIDDDQRVVYGWASVIEEDGVPIVDTQGDMIEPAELERAAFDFVTKARVGGVLHMRAPDGKPIKVAEVVASFPMTREVQKAFGISMPQAGWIIGVKVMSDEVWKMVKSGEFQGFSIGGDGTRTAADL